MQRAIIVGNSGAARECHQLLMDCIWQSPTMRFDLFFGGFLSYKNYQSDLGPLSGSFLGDLDSFTQETADRFIIGVGDPNLRYEIFHALKERDCHFINLISPWSYVPGDFVMGEANIISSTCNFSGGSSIGDGNYFNGNVRLGHDVTIGSCNFFAPSATILGGAKVGDRNLMAVQSVLLDHAKIGDNNRIAPGSIVFKGCRDNCRLAGNPALKIASL